MYIFCVVIPTLNWCYLSLTSTAVYPLSFAVAVKFSFLVSLFLRKTFFLFNIPLLGQSISQFLIGHKVYWDLLSHGFSDMSRHTFGILNFVRYNVRLQSLGYKLYVTVELITTFTEDYCIWDSKYVKNISLRELQPP